MWKSDLGAQTFYQFELISGITAPDRRCCRARSL